MNEKTSVPVSGIDQVRSKLDKPCYSEWLNVTQDRITAFGGITLDFDPEHLHPSWGADSQFGVTVNHGFLTLSLLTHFLDTTGIVPAHRNHMNYGLDRVRWTAPVPVGSRIRARFDLAGIEQKSDHVFQIAFDVTVEIESQEKPAMLARWLVRIEI